MPTITRPGLLRYLPVVSLVLLAAALSLRTVQSPDLWWHLASGKWMLENRTLLDRDVFTFTSPDIPWINRTWLSAIAFYLMYAAGGLAAVCLFTAALVTGVFVLVATTRQAGRHPVAFALLGLLVLAVAQTRFLHRPSILSDLLAPIAIVLWLRWRDGHSRVAAPVALVVIQVIWTHLHGGFVLGLLIAGAFLVEAVVRRIAFSKTSPQPSPAVGRSAAPDSPPVAVDAPGWIAPAAVLCAGVAAVLLTPWRDALLASLWGFVVRLAPALAGRSEVALPETARDASSEGVRNIVAEWLPTFSPMGRRMLGPFFPFIVVLAGLAVVLVTRSWMRQRSRAHRAGPGPVRLAETLLLSAFVILAVVGLRFLGTLALAGFPLLWDLLKDEMESRKAEPARTKRKAQRGDERNLAPGLVVSALLLSLVLVVVTNSYYRYWHAPIRFGVGVMQHLFPEELADWLQQTSTEGRFFNGYDMGGYLDWRFGPTKRVFTDSRVVSEEVYKDYVNVVNSTTAWPQLVARYHLDGAILDKRDRDGQTRLYNTLKADSEWTVAYEDLRYALIIKKPAAAEK